jgi:hypothetical protein
MTDAAIPVTGRAVERFVEAYLTSLGAKIEKDGRQWSVVLPDDADTDLELDGTVLEIADDPADVEEGAVPIAPESPFVERVLDEAADRTPVGSVSFTSDGVDIRFPPWITDGPTDVEEATFTPYYDRLAVCALFHVGIETVSEYQREELRAVAIDLNDEEERPRLAESYLDLVNDDQRELNEGDRIDEARLKDALDGAHTAVENDVSSVVLETRERATRAADIELDEYRQFVRQRRDELSDEIENLSDRIEEVNETIEAASEQQERVDGLRKRKELQMELDDLRSEHDELSSQIETGFPEKRHEIRERHALTVRIRPVAATAISYERGDLELALQSNSTTFSRTYGYAVGVGVMEDANCERCGKPLTAENPLTITGNRTIGASCCGE